MENGEELIGNANSPLKTVLTSFHESHFCFGRELGQLATILASEQCVGRISFAASGTICKPEIIVLSSFGLFLFTRDHQRNREKE